MPRYKVTLEVEFFCPVLRDKPELAITKDDIEAFLNDLNGRAVCVPDRLDKTTAEMRVLSVVFKE